MDPLRDGLNDNGGAIDDDALGHGLPQTTDQRLASLGRLVLRLSNEMLVETASKLPLSAVDERTDLDIRNN